MSDRFGKLAERQMQKALAEKKLSGLEGEGHPLPERPEAAFVDAGEAVADRNCGLSPRHDQAPLYRPRPEPARHRALRRPRNAGARPRRALHRTPWRE